MGFRVSLKRKTPVPTPLQTACEWTRVTNWRFYEDGSEGTVVRYQPGRVSVEYRREDDGPTRLERVLIYTRHDDQTIMIVPTTDRLNFEKLEWQGWQMIRTVEMDGRIAIDQDVRSEQSQE